MIYSVPVKSCRMQKVRTELLTTYLKGESHGTLKGEE